MIMGVAALAVSLAAPAKASFIGHEMTASYRFPNLGQVYAFSEWTPATFTVGAGVETVGDVEGVTRLDTDFSATSLVLTLTAILNTPTWNAAAFNGPVFALTSGTLGVLSATVSASTTMAGFDISRVAVTANEIQLNWADLAYVDGTVIAIDFNFGETPVPEPGTLALVGLGLAGLFAARRRSTAASPS